MKIKNAAEILIVLQKTYDQKLPAKSAYKIMRVAKVLEPEYTFYAKKVSEIIKEYASGTEEYKKAMADLDEIDSEIEVPKIKLSDIESLSLTPKEIYILEPIIEEES